MVDRLIFCLLSFQLTSAQTIIPPPQKIAVDYSIREEHNRHKDLYGQPTSSSTPTPSLLIQSGGNSIDLNEWRDHRVLAQRDGYYYPGVIRNAVDESLYVVFDTDNEVTKFTNVLSSRRYDVISDASPSVGQITLNSKVCFRCPNIVSNSSGGNLHCDSGYTNVFVAGVVCKILDNKPKSFIVQKLTKLANESYVVKRADLRLLQPPWHDELEESGSEDHHQQQQQRHFSHPQHHVQQQHHHHHHHQHHQHRNSNSEAMGNTECIQFSNMVLLFNFYK